MCRLNNIILSLIFCVSYNWAKEMTEIEALAAKPKHCTYEYAFDMYGAYCAGLRLTKLPKLRGGIEILDLSDNKLQELRSDTLSGYSSIQYLYLAENQMYQIDEDALTSLTSLQTLDLSNNVILNLPNSIFQLPSLRKLYLKGNPLLHMSFSDHPLKIPIRAPLELLDLSDCKIKTLPNWGSLPQLLLYNISHNPLTSLDPKHFSGLCNLQKVDITDSIELINVCDIKPAIFWFKEKHVYFQLEDYSKLNSREFDACTVPKDTGIYNATYNSCKSEYLEVQNIKSSRRTWLTIGGSLAGFLVGFILLLYIMHRHNVAQTKTTAEKIKQATPTHDGDKNATAILLNDAS